MMHGRSALRKPLNPANQFDFEVSFAPLDWGSGTKKKR